MTKVSLALATLLLYVSFLSFITSGDVDILQSDDTGLVKSTLSVLTVLVVQLKAFTLN